ncbi:MAG: helix-turn-helix domain-containing protein [Streptosporangiaceae bacterium]
MALGKDYERQNCALARALELVGERWTLLVVRDALYGVRRYSDFLVHLDIPRAVLAERLQALTAAGVLEKRRYQESPPREEYVLTEMGQQLWPAVHALHRWAVDFLLPEGPIRLYVHTTCGTRLDPAGICPDCGTLVTARDVEMRPGPAAAVEARTDSVSEKLSRPRRLLTPIHT